MTKENFINKWCRIYEINTTKPAFTADIEAVIAHEIAKVQEVKLEDAQPQEKPALNPIAEAYEQGEKIRRKNWYITHWIKKYSETEAIDEPKNIYDVTNWAFRTEPHEWELYTEPEQPEQTSSQGKLDNSFDRERFERLFCAVVAREPHWAYNYCINETEKALAKLDAYYASKEGGNNG